MGGCKSVLHMTQNREVVDEGLVQEVGQSRVAFGYKQYGAEKYQNVVAHECLGFIQSVSFLE